MRRDKRDISILDLDRTITKSGTYSASLIFSAAALCPWRLLLAPVVAPAYVAYLTRLIDRRQLKAVMQWAALGSGLPRDVVERSAESFAARLFAIGLRPEAQYQILREQALGRRVIIATAASLLYVSPLARRLGIDDVIASRPTWRGNKLECRIAGENCYGAAKLRRIQSFFRENGIERTSVHVRFFSDGMTDLPTFKWADEPIVVNPSRKLSVIAREQNWRVLNWRTRKLSNAKYARAPLT